MDDFVPGKDIPANLDQLVEDARLRVLDALEGQEPDGDGPTFMLGLPEDASRVHFITVPPPVEAIPGVFAALATQWIGAARITRMVYATPVWMRAVKTPDEAADLTVEGLEQDPQAFEAIVLQAQESRRDGYADIARLLRADDGPPTLAPWKRVVGGEGDELVRTQRALDAVKGGVPFDRDVAPFKRRTSW